MRNVACADCGYPVPEGSRCPICMSSDTGNPITDAGTGPDGRESRQAPGIANETTIKAEVIEIRDLSGNLLHSVEGKSLRGAILGGVFLQRAQLQGVDLSNANLEAADFSEADLSGAILRGANLRNAKFDGATLCKADLSRSTVKRNPLSFSTNSATTVVDPLENSISMRGTNLEGADLSGVEYVGDFRDADFRGTSLANAWIYGDLSGADLRFVDLTTFRFKLSGRKGGTRRAFPITDATTVFPPGVAGILMQLRLFSFLLFIALSWIGSWPVILVLVAITRTWFDITGPPDTNAYLFHVFWISQVISAFSVGFYLRNRRVTLPTDQSSKGNQME